MSMRWLVTIRRSCDETCDDRYSVVSQFGVLQTFTERNKDIESKHDVSIKPDSFYSMAQTDAVEKYLRMIGHAMSLDDIYQALSRSVLRGISAMSFRNTATWRIKLMPRGFWIHAWTPTWHEGRGPFLSIGIYLFAVYRGY